MLKSVVFEQDIREQDTREGCPYILCTCIFYFLWRGIFFIENSAHIPLKMSSNFGPAFGRIVKGNSVF